MTRLRPCRAPRILLVLTLLSGGCASGVVPPSATADPVTVAVTDYGRHSSLVLPDDDDDAGSVEYAFGDWNWFAAGHTSLGDAFNAMFRSERSTLGRRHHAVAIDAPELGKRLGAPYVLRFQVSRERVVAVRRRLDERYESNADREVFNAYMGLWFVPDDEPYGLRRNCNHITARWLRELGCEIRGSAFWSRFELRE